MPVQPRPPPTYAPTYLLSSPWENRCILKVVSCLFCILCHFKKSLTKKSLSKWRLFRPSDESHLFQLKHCHLVSIKYTMPSVWIIYDSDSLPVTRQCTFHAFVISNKNQKIFVAVHSKLIFCNRIKEFTYPAKRNILSISPCYVFVVGL